MPTSTDKLRRFGGFVGSMIEIQSPKQTSDPTSYQTILKAYYNEAATERQIIMDGNVTITGDLQVNGSDHLFSGEMVSTDNVHILNDATGSNGRLVWTSGASSQGGGLGVRVIDATTSGYQELGLSGLSGTDSTGLADDTYYFKVTFDDSGVENEYSIIVSGGAPDYNGLITLLNGVTYSNGDGTWSLESGDLRLTSAATGDTSTVLLSAGTSGTDLFNALSATAPYDSQVYGEDMYEFLRIFNNSFSYTPSFGPQRSDYVWRTAVDMACNILRTYGDIFFNHQGSVVSLSDTIDAIETSPTYTTPITSNNGQTYSSPGTASDVANVEYSRNMSISSVLENNPIELVLPIEEVPSLYSSSGDIEYVIDLTSIDLTNYISEFSSATTPDKPFDVKYVLDVEMDNTHSAGTTRHVVAGFYNGGNVLQYNLFDAEVNDNQTAYIKNLVLHIPTLYYFGDTSGLASFDNTGGRKIIFNVDQNLEVSITLKLYVKRTSYISTSDYIS